MGQSGGWVNSSRFRLRVGRELRRNVASFANDFAKKMYGLFSVIIKYSGF